MRTVLPLYVHPLDAPTAWQAERLGDVTVVVNVHDGPGKKPSAVYEVVLAQLAEGGVPLLGYVDLAYVSRPLADILEEIERWAAYRVNGIFFHAAPTSPFGLGPVSMAIRVARGFGLRDLILNPGEPTDPVYRDLDVPICTFEGSWQDYQRWPPKGSQPGDGHLVYGVPTDKVDAARRLMLLRHAGFGLATDLDLPHPYAGLPASMGELSPTP
ncbi:Spherulation-specific family 4 [Micromonospora pattaloongensis]|uniref:Spherulation-specific family 4 n=1 Tax=Micromonospora pattaloongensis TaxID=405436 RepID=A0A1H3KTU8_9ACTN|nr:spherulation-specific family 4 protein [Micromonospora pattaloongensis]SDY55085.1 Spherulation-specific family 4 [Micromonospora pattaloongensis]